MKILRLVSLLLVVVLLGAGLMSCGGAVVSVKVRLAVIKGNHDAELSEKDLLVPVIEGVIKGTENDPPTVLQAAKEILEENSIQFTDDESEGGRITSIKNQKERSANGIVSTWIPYLNGEEMKGLASATVVHDGDYIVYYLQSYGLTDAIDDPDVTDEETEPETEEETEEETEPETEEESD